MAIKRVAAIKLTLGALALGGAVLAIAVPADASTPTATKSAGHVSAVAVHSGAANQAVAVARRAPASVVSTAGSCATYRAGTAGDFCLWYYQNYVGSRVGVFDNTPDLRPVHFQTTGSGSGQSAYRNVESDYNYDTLYTAHVCTGLNYTGSCGYVSPRSGGNFSSTYSNKDASIYWTH
ncbi:MAG: peptidase inhibitor family I36 protein [Frankia sp.]